MMIIFVDPSAQIRSGKLHEFAAYRHCLHGLLDFLDHIQQLNGPIPSSAAVEGRGLGDCKFEPNVALFLKQLYLRMHMGRDFNALLGGISSLNLI